MQYYTRTGHVRPTTAPMRKDGTKSKHTSLLFKNGNRPPKGMHVNHDDLVALATGPATQGEQLLKSMDRSVRQLPTKTTCTSYLVIRYVMDQLMIQTIQLNNSSNL